MNPVFLPLSGNSSLWAPALTDDSQRSFTSVLLSLGLSWLLHIGEFFCFFVCFICTCLQVSRIARISSDAAKFWRGVSSWRKADGWLNDWLWWMKVEVQTPPSPPLKKKKKERERKKENSTRRSIEPCGSPNVSGTEEGAEFFVRTVNDSCSADMIATTVRNVFNRWYHKPMWTGSVYALANFK